MTSKKSSLYYVDMQHVFDNYCLSYNIPHKEMYGSKRRDSLSTKRMQLMWLLYESCSPTYYKLSKFLGKDRTTIRNAVAKVEALRATDSDVLLETNLWLNVFKGNANGSNSSIEKVTTKNRHALVEINPDDNIIKMVVINA